MPTTLEGALSVISGSTRYNRWIYHSLRDYLSGVVLDIGSGFGDIARYYSSQDKVRRVIVSDKAKEMIERLESSFGKNEKYRVIGMDIAALSVDNETVVRSADTVTCVNALEHIEQDARALQDMYRLMKKGARLVLFVPALPCLYGTLDKLHGHYRRYGREEMRVKLNAAGFRIRAQEFINFFGILTWFLAARVLRQRRFIRTQCNILDRFVPLLENIESIFNPPLGQSLLTVCIKE